MRELFHDSSIHGNTSCPTCRSVFFPGISLEPMKLLITRPKLLDYAYGYAGIARSAKDEHSRKYLWKYMKYCLLIDGMNMYGESERILIREA